MESQNNYICKQASIEEITKKWDYEVKIHPENKLYPFARKEFIEEAIKGTRISYVGILNNEIICDATVIIKQEGIKNEATLTDEIIHNKRVYLCGLRTNKEYENKGYFSKLYHYMEKDLRKKGYEELSLSVDISKTRNLMIYFKWGYTNFISTQVVHGKGKDFYFNYYYKKISQ